MKAPIILGASTEKYFDRLSETLDQKNQGLMAAYSSTVLDSIPITIFVDWTLSHNAETQTTRRACT